MSDPKYISKDGFLYHIDGYKLPDDEPLMVFRGKDIGSLDAICEYIEMLEDQPQNKVIVSHLYLQLKGFILFILIKKIIQN